MKKRFLNKKAESSGTVFPLQAVVEVVMIVTVGLIFLAYGAYLVQDQRIFQTFYAKDLSLVQDFMILHPEDMLIEYTGPNNGKFSELDYEITSTHSHAIFTGSFIKQGSQTIKKSYIHFLNPDFVTFSAKKPSSLFFLKHEGKLSIHEQNPSLPLRSLSCKTFEASQYYYFISEELTLSPLGFGSTDQFNFNKELPRDGREFTSLIFERLSSDDTLLLYTPLNDQELGCTLYNALISKPQLKDWTIRLIPSSTIKLRGEDHKTSLIIETNQEGSRLILDTLRGIV